MTTPIEERMARIEGSFEQIDRRLGNIEQEFRDFRGSTEQEFHSLRGELNTKFYWLLGTMLATWVTNMLAILLRGP